MQVPIGATAMPFDDRKEHTDGPQDAVPHSGLSAAAGGPACRNDGTDCRPELAEQTPKERALTAVGLLQDAADRRAISLKLNRTPKKE